MKLNLTFFELLPGIIIFEFFSNGFYIKIIYRALSFLPMKMSIASFAFCFQFLHGEYKFSLLNAS